MLYYIFLSYKFISTGTSCLLGILYLKLWGIKCFWDTRLFGIPGIEVSNSSKISIGHKCILRSARWSNIAGITRPIRLSARFGGNITIGNNCGLSGTVIVSENSVTIGNNVQIGVNCTIIDTDFHPLNAYERSIPKSRGHSLPIIIEDDVWLGMNVIVLKGVKIGSQTVVGAGSVVTHSLPPKVLAAGNPAKVIRILD